MLDPDLMPDFNSIKKEMDSYEIFHQLERHLDATMPNEVIDSISYADKEYDESRTTQHL